MIEIDNDNYMDITKYSLEYSGFVLESLMEEKSEEGWCIDSEEGCRQSQRHWGQDGRWQSQ